MWKIVVLAILAIVPCIDAARSQSQAPPGHDEMLNAAQWRSLTEARIDAVKLALGMSAEQMKLWPPIEEAIRARGQGRYLRLQAFAAAAEDDKAPDVIALMKRRAANLAERSAELNRLADAWGPLYLTLDASQKTRLRILAVYALREMRDAIESRQLEQFDEFDLDE